MRVQVNTDNQIKGSEQFEAEVRSAVLRSLRRIGSRITRVEVHLSDQNSKSKVAADDHRCVVEARLGGMKPVSVSHDAASPKTALTGATKKLVQLLDRTLGRLEAPKGRPTIRGRQAKSARSTRRQ